MAEEQDQDDKTEDPTARRMEATLYYGGFWFAPKFLELFKGALILEPRLIFAVFNRHCAGGGHCLRLGWFCIFGKSCGTEVE